MGCGCKKKKTQESNVGVSKLIVTESKPKVQEPQTILTPDQQQQVDEIIEKINQTKIIRNLSSLYSTYYFGKPDNKYTNEYWYELFGKNLNSEELAIYYAYFITKYIMSGSNWCCVAYPDGFIKLLGAESDGSVSLSPYQSEIYIRFTNYYLKNKMHITYEYNFKTNSRISIDENLLKKYVGYIFENSVHDKNVVNSYSYIRPTIRETFEKFYPIVSHLKNNTI